MLNHYYFSGIIRTWLLCKIHTCIMLLFCVFILFCFLHCASVWIYIFFYWPVCQFTNSLFCVSICCIVKSIYWEINTNYCLFHANSHFRFFFGVTVYKVISELQKFFSCFCNSCIPSFTLGYQNQTDRKPEDIFFC